MRNQSYIVKRMSVLRKPIELRQIQRVSIECQTIDGRGTVIWHWDIILKSSQQSELHPGSSSTHPRRVGEIMLVLEVQDQTIN